MARSSPGVQRMVAVINFFAEHPDQSFTLTDLVRALRLSRATCHMLLAGLVEAGYLYRNKDKSYILGPTLAAIGRIASNHFSPLQVAQSEIRELADQFDAICSASFIEGDEVVTRARAAAMSQLGWPSSLGVRMKIRAPFIAIYGGWMSASEFDAWIGELGLQPSAEQREEMRQGILFARKHGYCYGVRNFFERASARAAVEKSFAEGLVDVPVSMGTEIDPGHSYSLAFISSPVLDASNKIAFTLGLVGFDAHIKGAQIELMGRRLREACDRITHFIQGRQPQALIGAGEVVPELTDSD